MARKMFGSIVRTFSVVSRDGFLHDWPILADDPDGQALERLLVLREEQIVHVPESFEVVCTQVDRSVGRLRRDSEHNRDGALFSIPSQSESCWSRVSPFTFLPSPCLR